MNGEAGEIGVSSARVEMVHRERFASKTIVAFCALLALLAGIAGWRAYSDYRIRVLYSGFYSDQGDSSQQLEIVRKLEVYRSRESSEKLLAIATDEPGRRGMVVWPDVRIQAIKSLHGRTEIDLDQKIAKIIQPHEPLVVRRAAADELMSRACTRYCVDELLHYLEREFHGDAAVETQLAGGYEDKIALARADLHNRLLQVLRNNPIDTLQELRQMHGLGSWMPSSFGSTIASELQVGAACSALTRSHDLRQQYRLSPDPALDRAVTACK